MYYSDPEYHGTYKRSKLYKADSESCIANRCSGATATMMQKDIPNSEKERCKPALSNEE